LVEEVVEVRKGSAALTATGSLGKAKKPVLLGEAQMHELPRIQLPGQELNRILGDGLMPGSVVLIGGEPGIGKSTLLLQLAIDTKMKVLYVSGEESELQIQQRAQRIGLRNNQCYLLAETSTQNILKEIEEIQP
jgi:DNA repair protein RadA/Sms